MFCFSSSSPWDWSGRGRVGRGSCRPGCEREDGRGAGGEQQRRCWGQEQQVVDQWGPGWGWGGARSMMTCSCYSDQQETCPVLMIWTGPLPWSWRLHCGWLLETSSWMLMLLQHCSETSLQLQTPPQLQILPPWLDCWEKLVVSLIHTKICVQGQY